MYDNSIDIYDDINGILIFSNDVNKQQTIMNYNCSFIRFFPEYLVSFIPFYFDTKSQLKTNDEIKEYYNYLFSHNIKHCCWLINKNKMLDQKFIKYYRKLTGKHLFSNNIIYIQIL